jgi:hypothetical protein
MTGQNGAAAAMWAAANLWQFAEVLAVGAARRFRWETVLPLPVTPLLFPRLLCPGQRGAVARIQNRHGRPLATMDQPRENLGRRTAQPQLPTDVPLRQPNGDGKVAIRAELAGVPAPPPVPGPTDRAQDMGVLRLALAGQIVGGRPDLWRRSTSPR